MRNEFDTAYRLTERVQSWVELMSSPGQRKAMRRYRKDFGPMGPPYNLAGFQNHSSSPTELGNYLLQAVMLYVHGDEWFLSVDFPRPDEEATRMVSLLQDPAVVEWMSIVGPRRHGLKGPAEWARDGLGIMSRILEQRMSSIVAGHDGRYHGIERDSVELEQWSVGSVIAKDHESPLAAVIADGNEYPMTLHDSSARSSANKMRRMSNDLRLELSCSVPRALSDMRRARQGIEACANEISDAADSNVYPSNYLICRTLSYDINRLRDIAQP